MKHAPSLLGKSGLFQEPAGWWPNLSRVQGMLARKGCALDGCLPEPSRAPAACRPVSSSLQLLFTCPLHQQTSWNPLVLGERTARTDVLQWESSSCWPSKVPCSGFVLCPGTTSEALKKLPSQVPFLNSLSCRQKRAELPQPEALPGPSRLCREDTLLP